MFLLTLRDSELKAVKWRLRIAMFIHNCSFIPPQWFQKDDYLVEVACWFDETAFYARHETFWVDAYEGVI